VTKLAYNNGSRYQKDSIKNYKEFINVLPATITRVWSKGKKLIISLSNDCHILNSLAMEGKWLLKPAKHSNLWIEFEKESEKEVPLYYDDARHFGSIELILNSTRLIERLSKIGPYLLLDPVDLEQWLSVVRNSRLKKMEICHFLLKFR